jgi:hypothetical protein
LLQESLSNNEEINFLPFLIGLTFALDFSTMRLLQFLLILFFVCFTMSVGAQDSVATQTLTDTSINIKKVKLPAKIFQPDAKRAGLYSALIPGLGQLYNRQYWKLPIVYAVLGTTVYFAARSNNEYERYRKAYVSRIANEQTSQDEFQGILSLSGIKQYQDEARENRDLMIVFSVIAYAGQIMEAISGAHLRNFDISKDLSMQVSPVITPINTLGLGLVVNFKK